ncbi:sugar ABC transporter substrate-binding protein [Vibrio nigripulchritudo]|uniref:sugar ABC transporter substrate-binding protein n=1 Tax=Vibrio nigripulchritudo TaxID=28173 RepID=UPI0003B1D302|nr:substrate-binding domain-containing protein [Vibrio nigripulchritudo]CCN68785.1 putative ABC-type sugar transport system,periplasmic component [Vibrio nigripulchritudo SFn118]
MKGILSFAPSFVFGVALSLISVSVSASTDFLKGQLLSDSEYADLVALAKEKNPPKNGKQYVFGFANLQRNIAFGVKVEQGIEKNANKAGVALVIADNRLDGPTALKNAQSFARRNVDYAIEFQTDINFGPAVMKPFNQKSIGVTAIDIPMKGATFFGANNPKSGFMGGTFLAQAAVAEWGEDKVNKGYLVVGGLAQSGAVVGMRTGGQIAGFQAKLPGFNEDNIIIIDTKNTLQESFNQMKNVLGRIPKDAVVMGIAINDQSALGMLRAVQQAQREDQSLFVGMGADELEPLVSEDRFVASVGYFPERYGNYLVPIALMSLAGLDIPDSVLVNHVMVTKNNICEFYYEHKCRDGKGMQLELDTAKLSAHLDSLRSDPNLKGFESLVPAQP